MIGPKKLSAIREELQRALSATGDDPIRWLEERMTTPAYQGAENTGESEILHSLRRVLEATGRKKRQTQQGGMKK